MTTQLVLFPIPASYWVQADLVIGEKSTERLHLVGGEMIEADTFIELVAKYSELEQHESI